MSLCFSLVCMSAIAWVSGLDRPIYDLERAAELFQEFKATYNRTYDGDVEHDMRLEVFTNNLERLNYLNTLDGAVYGIDIFADITNDEFNSRMGCVNYDHSVGGGLCETVQYTPSGTPPASLDYRTKNMVSPVKNQGKCGSCYAFSAIGAIEGQYAKKSGSVASFSAQQIVDCDKKDGGCSGGMMDNVLEYVHDNGLETNEDYPYTDTQKACHHQPSKSKVKVSSCKVLKVTNEEHMKSALHEYGPISIGVDATDLQGYHGGLIRTCKSEKLNHGMLLVGYGKEGSESFWIVKNSWATSWGEQGYGKIVMGSNLCYITSFLSVAKVA